MPRTSAKAPDRPTEYSHELAQVILDRMADGEMLDAICKDGDMPTRTTVDGWAINSDIDGFAGHLVRAREALAYRLAEQAVAASQDPEKGNINERRLLADQLWKFAAIAAPMGFGKQGYRPSRGMMASGGALGAPAPSTPASGDDEGDSAAGCPDHLRHLIHNIAAEDVPDDRVNGKPSNLIDGPE